MAQLRVFLPRAGLWTSLLSFCPFLGALLIAISRLEDYRHDVFDVVVGSCLGVFVAYFSWRRYYPGLSSWECSEPYPAHAGDEKNGGPLGKFGRIREEEEMIGSAREFELSDDEGRGSVSAPWTR